MIRWRYVGDVSSNVKLIGWPATGEPLLLVRFKSGLTYGYSGVSRQRAVALACRRKLWGRSIGQYLNKVIKPSFSVLKIEHESGDPDLDEDGWPARWSDPTYLGDGPWGA